MGTSRARRVFARVTATILLTVVAGVVVVRWVQQARAQPIYCQTTSESRQPVLLVHGYDSGPKTWGPAARRRLADAGPQTCIAIFDYATWSTHWVTDPHIGPALAAQIDTLAAASRSSGGSGKVIVVAHSMGGLAARCAINAACGKHGNLAGSVRELITFDTPNTGSWLRAVHLTDDTFDALASALSASCYASSNQTDALCRQIRALGTSAAAKALTPGSVQLRHLPHMPTGVPVFAVAGRVELVTSIFGWRSGDLGDAGDLIVKEDSALAEAARYDGLGGRQIINCGTANISPSLRGATCSHSTETDDPRFLATTAHQIATAEVRNP